MSHALKSKRPADRRPLLWVVVVAALVVLILLIVPWLRETLSSTAPDYWPTTAWRSSTPEAQGLDSEVLAKAIEDWHAQGLPIHSLTIVRNGYVVTDATFYPYDGQTVHDVASVTKSVMTTLIGIAADQGKLDLDDPMVSFFPEYTIANLDERKQAITVRHLASMTSGLRCTRDGYPNPTAQEMHASADFVQFVLDLPMAAQPGSTFVYCSPAIHLLSPILQKATGMTPLAFAQEYLFAPLGIQDATWEQDPQGYYAGWGDLALKPADMAKIGLLFLQGGRWEDKQVVSRQWVEEATKMQVAAPNEDPYGYGWWVTDDPVPVFRADGRQGQYIIGLPEWQLLVVTTGGGFELDAIDDALLASFADMEHPLPANPDAVARLQAAVAAAAQSPVAQPVPPLPAMAQAIAGQVYVFDRNAVGLNSVALAFDGSAEAQATLGLSGRDPVTVAVGLDGLFRTTTALDNGNAVGLRGAWADAQTFVLEYNAFSSNDQITLRLRFDGERAVVSVDETASMPALEFAGRRQE